MEKVYLAALVACCCCGLISASVIEVSQLAACKQASGLLVLPQDTTAAIGGSVSLKCNLITPEVTWTFTPAGSTASQVIVNHCWRSTCQPVPGLDSRYQTDTSSGSCNLVISPISQDQLGTYTCQDVSGQVSASAVVSLPATTAAPTTAAPTTAAPTTAAPTTTTTQPTTTTTTPTTTTTTPPPRPCTTAGFTWFPGVGCYQLLLQKKTFSTAGAGCATLAPTARAVVITSQAQEDAIRGMITPYYSTTAADAKCGAGFWTAGRRAADNCVNDWVWQPSGAPITGYFDWAGDGIPNCGVSKNEFCVHLWFSNGFHWNDVTCSTSQCVICELPGNF